MIPELTKIISTFRSWSTRCILLQAKKKVLEAIATEIKKLVAEQEKEEAILIETIVQTGPQLVDGFRVSTDVVQPKEAVTRIGADELIAGMKKKDEQKAKEMETLKKELMEEKEKKNQEEAKKKQTFTLRVEPIEPPMEVVK